ncbi:ATP-binding protein [Desulfovibrio subterraneus]|uniref:ATP-binding protein n=1 Tax=Desulfovibrio subterraneus TaxID=2718620 RepID=UPI0022B90D7C|nr:ATP-binding protein [Desulfovibrio subterraneus]WBF66647.1 ATP-binding protein [Desulfovibrio subterraneus]
MPKDNTLTEGVDYFVNAKQVTDHLHGLGYTVAYNTIAKFLKQNGIPKRRRGGWTAQSVEQFALAMWSDKLKVDPSAAASAPIVSAADGSSAAEERTQNDAILRGIQAQTALFRLEKDKGRYVLISTMDAELGARAKAFRIGLQKFGIDVSDRVAALFGGSRKAAEALARKLGTPEEEMDAVVLKIVDYQLSRADRFARLWKNEVEKLLDPYGTDLGTYSAQLIAKAHGGRIELMRSNPEGTTLSVHLPHAHY